MNVRFIEWKLSFTTRGGCPLLYFVEFDSLFLWNMGNSQRLHAAWTTWRLLIIHWPPLLQSEKINPGMEGCPPPSWLGLNTRMIFFSATPGNPKLNLPNCMIASWEGWNSTRISSNTGFCYIYIYIYIPFKTPTKTGGWWNPSPTPPKIWWQISISWYLTLMSDQTAWIPCGCLCRRLAHLQVYWCGSLVRKCEAISSTWAMKKRAPGWLGDL